jgi:hypothetical protein
MGYDAASVGPEPLTLLLFVSGGLLIVVRRLRVRRQPKTVAQSLVNR